jgi:tetratricopeptide (TPR) repeat protein
VADNPRIEELRRRVQKDPASIAFAQLAEEHRRAGNHKEAIAVCRAGLAIHPGYLSARVTLGRALIEANDLITAETELKAVLRAAPDNLAAIRALAEVHHRSGHSDQALQFYKTALDLSGNDPALEHTVEKIAASQQQEQKQTAAVAPSPAASAVAAPPAPVAREVPAIAPPAPSALATEASAVVPPSPPFAAVVAADCAATDAPPSEASIVEKCAEAAALEALERFLEVVRRYRERSGISPPASVVRTVAEVVPLVPKARQKPALPELERFLDAIHSYRQRQAV